MELELELDKEEEEEEEKGVEEDSSRVLPGEEHHRRIRRSCLHLFLVAEC